MEQKKKHIKVNIPRTVEEYKHGDGEGVWVIVDTETKRDHDEDIAGGVYYGILDDRCGNYPALSPCDVIFFTMRGPERPVAIFDTLPGHMFTATRKKELLLQIEMR